MLQALIAFLALLTTGVAPAIGLQITASIPPHFSVKAIRQQHEEAKRITSALFRLTGWILFSLLIALLMLTNIPELPAPWLSRVPRQLVPADALELVLQGALFLALFTVGDRIFIVRAVYLGALEQKFKEAERSAIERTTTIADIAINKEGLGFETAPDFGRRREVRPEKA